MKASNVFFMFSLSYLYSANFIRASENYSWIRNYIYCRKWGGFYFSL